MTARGAPGAAEQHHALGDARAPVASTPEFLIFERMVIARLQAFLRGAAASRGTDAAFGAWFTFTVATSVGERIVARNVGVKEANRIGEATARMLADALGLNAD